MAKKTRILVVEDDKIIALIIETKLVELGYSISGNVSKGEEAIRLIREDPPNLVLMDIKLKGSMDGIEAAEEIRKLRDLPIIYLTGNTGDDIVKRAKQTQPFGYIIKPFNTRELEAVIQITLYRHRLENELKTKEERYRRLFEHSNDAVFIHSLSGTIFDVNKKSCLMLGYQREDFLKLKMTDLFPEKEKTALRKSYKLIKEKGYHHYESLMMKKDDTLINVDINSSMIDQSSRHIQAIVRDVSERKEAEHVIRESEEQYRTLVDCSLDHIYIMNLDGVFIRSNGHISLHKTLLDDPILGHHFKEFYSHENAELFGKMIKKVIRNKTAVEFEHDMFEGKELVNHLATLYPLIRDGKIWAIGGICRDITEKKRMDQALKISERTQHLASLGTMAAGISHEINQPLSALKVKVDSMLYWGEKDPSSLQKNLIRNLTFISEESFKIDQIIRHMRSLVQSEKAEPKPIQLNSVIISAAQLIHEQFNSHGISLQMELEENLPCAWANETPIEQVVLNLLSNARYELDLIDMEKKSVLVKTLSSDHTIVFSVEDNGKGIPQEDVHRIFDPFFTTKSHEESMGLGLFIVQNLINGYGGEIQAENREQGGARFIVSLPKCET